MSTEYEAANINMSSARTSISDSKKRRSDAKLRGSTSTARVPFRESEDFGVSSYSAYDKSRSFSAVMQEGTAIQSMRASIPDVTQEALEASLQIDEEDNDDEYASERKQAELMQSMNFPVTKQQGIMQTLERMEYMSKHVGRLRSQSIHEPLSPTSPGRLGMVSRGARGRESMMSRSQRVQDGDHDDDGEMDGTEQNNSNDAGRSSMEERFTECCESSGNSEVEFRLMQLLGPEIEDQLFKEQMKIVEYFRHKNQLLDRKYGIQKMQDMFGGDDDALNELAAWHGEAETPRHADVKQQKGQDEIKFISEDSDATPLSAQREFADASPTTPGSPRKSQGQAAKDRRLSFASNGRRPSAFSVDAPLEKQISEGSSAEPSSPRSENPSSPKGARAAGPPSASRRLNRGFSSRLVRSRSNASLSAQTPSEGEPSPKSNEEVDSQGASLPGIEQTGAKKKNVKKNAAPNSGKKATKKQNGSLPTLPIQSKRTPAG